MNRLFQNISRTEFFIFWCIVLITSLPWSRFLVSVGIWGIVASSFLNWSDGFQNSNIKFKTKTPPQYLRPFFKNPILIALTVPFFLVVLSGLWSTDISVWLKRAQLRLPFLVIPLAISNIPNLNKKHVFLLLEVALLTFCTTIAVVLTNYSFHFDEINIALGEGRPMPFLKTHITFSIMASFALMGGLHLWRERYYFRFPFERKLIPALTIFLFIGLHVISVRSGLFATYICLFIKLIELIFKEKKYILGISSFLILMTIPVFAYKNIPSFQQRINYAIWDLGKYQENQIETYSDAQRIISYKMGWEVVKNNPILGVGAGDAESEIIKSYAQYYPNLGYKMPHNGWLFNAVEVGLLGLIFYIFSFFFIVFYKKAFQTELFLLLNVAIGVGQTVDYTFEGSFGCAFYVFFICLLSSRNEQGNLILEN